MNLNPTLSEVTGLLSDAGIVSVTLPIYRGYDTQLTALELQIEVGVVDTKPSYSTLVAEARATLVSTLPLEERLLVSRQLVRINNWTRAYLMNVAEQHGLCDRQGGAVVCLNVTTGTVTCIGIVSLPPLPQPVVELVPVEQHTVVELLPSSGNGEEGLGSRRSEYRPSGTAHGTKIGE